IMWSLNKTLSRFYIYDIFFIGNSMRKWGEKINENQKKQQPLQSAKELVTLQQNFILCSFEIVTSEGCVNNETDSDVNNHHDEEIYEEVDARNEMFYDDFDSSNSDVSDETYIKPLHQAGYDIRNGQLPEPPPGQNIYGISKIAEAGKKMLKLGKTLRKIRNKRNSSPQDIVDAFQVGMHRQAMKSGLHKNQEKGACPPLPSRPPPPSLPSRPVPPRMSDKSMSSRNLSGRKYWSLRKFKRSMSTSDQVSSVSPSSGSTFYIPQAMNPDVAVDGITLHRYVKNSTTVKSTTGKSVDSLEFPSENGDAPTTPSSVSSTMTIVGDSSAQRSSISSTNSKKEKPIPAPERRRNSAGIRPNSPPPLPPKPSAPVINRLPRLNLFIGANVDNYVQNVIFHSADTQNSIKDMPKKNTSKLDRPISNAWYAEVGLWDMSTSSPNDSSLSEQVTYNRKYFMPSSTSPENSGVAERLFADEPLYQFYTASIVEHRTMRDLRNELDSDGYEEIGDGTRKQQTRPTAMELIKPREGQHRKLWCEIPEVRNSHILSTITTHEKKLQEAKFEIITSEASYINSLNVLEKHFMSSPELNDESVLSKNDRRILFSNVIPVKTCSERFLADLEECWQDNIMLHGICDVVYKHATKYFNVYIKYCSNQIYLDRTLRALKEQHGKFSEVLAHLESSPVCQALSLHSFLMLPMQRITRLPLLIDAVFTRLNSDNTEYDTCKLALATINKIVQECNEGARKMERMEEILILHQQLGFPKEMKAVPIISSSRWLVKAGELTQLIWRGDEGKLTFGKKFSKVPLHLFLFNDLLFVTTKKKNEENFVVVDYCPRNLVQMTSTEGMAHLPVKYTADGGRNLMLLTMLQNHENKTVEMVLSCPLESDRQRWLEAVSPPVSDNPEETVYEEWDCPQVRAVHSYSSHQPDELSLDVGDVVNVLRKITDGWYQGERIRDGERGWFPR
ncbi:hypothetical protein L9F63_016527, partial [Diploptera punctata]